MRKGQHTIESWVMANGKSGDIFYTHKKDKDITAIATYYKREVLTERVIIVQGTWSNPSSFPLIKVTLK